MAAPYVHPQAIVETEEIGPDTRIWAFAHVMPEARVGAECNVCDHTYIDNGVARGATLLIEMYLTGVSMRRVEAITEKKGIN